MCGALWKNIKTASFGLPICECALCVSCRSSVGNAQWHSQTMLTLNCMTMLVLALLMGLATAEDGHEHDHEVRV